MQTWLVCARCPLGQERPIGLVNANTELAALARARTKASQLGSSFGADETIVIRATDAESSSQT
jgi:hypothetical protein